MIAPGSSCQGEALFSKSGFLFSSTHYPSLNTQTSQGQVRITTKGILYVLNQRNNPELHDQEWGESSELHRLADTHVDGRVAAVQLIALALGDFCGLDMV